MRSIILFTSPHEVFFASKVIAGGLPIQSLGVAPLGYTGGFLTNLDGVIGFGPEGLTYDTVGNMELVPSIMQNLKTQGMISSNVIGIFLHAERLFPTHFELSINLYSTPQTNHDVSGQLTLGGIDSSHFKGSMLYAHITSADIYNQFFAFDVSSIAFGSTTVMSESHPAILDSGSTLCRIPGAVLDAIMDAAGGSGFSHLEGRHTSPPCRRSHSTSTSTDILSRSRHICTSSPLLRPCPI
jgi:hypothetical protein